MNVIEVERGLHTCQDCQVDARWKVGKVYYCNRHFALFVRNNGLVYSPTESTLVNQEER